MLVSEFLNDDRFELVTDTINDKLIKGAYCGDLLSWVMANINDNYVWVTVHTHVNIIAVASLTGIPCIVIPENIKIEPYTVEKANDEGVILLGTFVLVKEYFSKD